MFSRAVSWFISTILTLLFLLFVLSNREMITLALWPFTATISAPLYLFFLLTVFVAFGVGLITMWFKQHKYRAEARRLQHELEAMQQALAAQKAAATSAELTPSKADNTALIAPAIY